MKNAPLLVLLLTALASSVGSAQAQSWQPPVGIPAPTFGITQTARPSPSPWIVPTVGFYYVDSTSASSTDSSNAYGTPARPRRTIPINLPAGAVVEVRGVYSYTHTSPRGIVSAGTAGAPVFIRGVAATGRPHATGCWEVSGSYFVIENLEFSDCGAIVFLSRTHHAALRHSEIDGTVSGGGVGVQSWNGDLINDVVLWNNQIHDNGDVNAGFDQDVHGIAVGARVSNLWVVDNVIYRNSGDGIQINAGSAGLQATTHHIYVGRNDSYENKQSGFWVKQATHVIFSQNRAFRHRPSDSSLGACMGSQYATDHVWFIDNAMWDCDYGIQIASDAGLGTGTLSFVIGNVITRIHDSDGGFETGSAWQNCAISLPGGTNRYVMQNSIYDVDSGVCVPHQQGVLYLYDNLIQKVRANGHHVMFDSNVMAEKMDARSNLFAPNLRFGISGSHLFYSTPEAVVRGENTLVLDVGWTDPVGGNFRLKPSAPGRDMGLMMTTGIWAYFKSRYGVDMFRDLYGTARGTSPDIGAAEYR
jgi:hypothetical protein